MTTYKQKASISFSHIFLTLWPVHHSRATHFSIANATPSKYSSPTYKQCTHMAWETARCSQQEDIDYISLNYSMHHTSKVIYFQLLNLPQTTHVNFSSTRLGDTSKPHSHNPKQCIIGRFCKQKGLYMMLLRQTHQLTNHAKISNKRTYNFHTSKPGTRSK